MLWLDHAEFVPVALDLLVEMGAAIRFVQQLPDRHVQQLQTKVIELYGLAALEAAPDHRVDTVTPIQNQTTVHPPSHTADPTRSTAPQTEQPIIPRWRDLFPSVFIGATLSQEREFLLGISLILVQKLALIRKPAFVR